MKSYLNLVQETLNLGSSEQTRTGINAQSIFGKTIEYSFTNDQFPLLTTKFVPIRLIASELEFFIKGITDKRWLKQRNNHIWDDWAYPKVLREKYSYEPRELDNTFYNSYLEYIIEGAIMDTRRFQNLLSKLNDHFILEGEIWIVKSSLNKEVLSCVTETI